MFIQSQALYEVGLCLLYVTFRSSVSIISGVSTIEPLYAVENDSDYVIAPQIPDRFLYSLSWCLSCASYQQSGIGLSPEDKDVSNGGRGWAIDQDPTKEARTKTFNQLRGEVRLEKSAVILHWVSCWQEIETQGVDSPDCQHRVTLIFERFGQPRPRLETQFLDQGRSMHVGLQQEHWTLSFFRQTCGKIQRNRGLPIPRQGTGNKEAF